MKTLTLLALLFATDLQAQEIPALAQFVSSEILHMNRAVDEQSAPTTYFFKQFYVRIQAMIGIEVPWTAKIQIVPELELLWQRTPPKS